MNRATFVSLAAALPAAAAPVVVSAATEASPLSRDGYLTELRTPMRHKIAFGAARVQDGSLLGFTLNALNGYESGWNERDVHAVAILFGSAAALALNDETWRNDRLAAVVRSYPNDFLRVNGEGNPFARSNNDVDGTRDRSIAALQRRGVRFYACNNALGDVARSAAAAGAAGGAESIHARYRANLLPGIALVPAGVVAALEAQAAGYSYFSCAL